MTAVSLCHCFSSDSCFFAAQNEFAPTGIICTVVSAVTACLCFHIRSMFNVVLLPCISYSSTICIRPFKTCGTTTSLLLTALEGYIPVKSTRCTIPRKLVKKCTPTSPRDDFLDLESSIEIDSQAAYRDRSCDLFRFCFFYCTQYTDSSVGR